MSAVTARQRWAGRQFFQRGVAHMCPPGHIRYKSRPKKKMLSCKPDTWRLDLRHHSHRPPAVGRVPATFHTSTLKVRAAQPTHPHTNHAPALSVRPPATHLTSPAPSRATVTPPIARTHATPCTDRPHRRSPSSSRPVVCRAVPAPAAGCKPNPRPAACPPAQPLHSPTCHLPNTCHPPC